MQMKRKNGCKNACKKTCNCPWRNLSVSWQSQGHHGKAIKCNKCLCYAHCDCFWTDIFPQSLPCTEIPLIVQTSESKVLLLTLAMTGMHCFNVPQQQVTSFPGHSLLEHVQFLVVIFLAVVHTYSSSSIHCPLADKTVNLLLSAPPTEQCRSRPSTAVLV